MLTCPLVKGDEVRHTPKETLHEGGLIDMGLEKSFKQVISMILTACVILALPGLALPQSTTSTTVAYGTAALPPPARGQMVQGNPITGLPGFSVDLGLSSATGMIAAVLI
jgi:hypothetical protein